MEREFPGGYNGRILRVNLSDKSIRTEDLTEQFCRKYLGGAGFVAYFLLKETPARLDALGPDNKLVFATGPFTGVALPGSGRHCVGAKSPLTGGIAKSEVGGFWGAELKRAGYDAVIVEGQSATPVYLWISNDTVEIRNAEPLWGLNTKETENAIMAELDDKRIRLATIGPGGENLVKYACIMHGLADAAGRSGLGAVMGSKKLKAIAVRGTMKVPVADADGVKKLRDWFASVEGRAKSLHDYGTSANMHRFEEVGNLPIRNFRDGGFPAIDDISAVRIKETIRIGMEGCFGCPVRCKKVVQVGEPYNVDPAYGGPEYETLGALGSNCGVEDLAAISKGSALCNAYSIDTISTGGSIAFAMECFENGLISLEDTGGIELRFGNSQAMLSMIDKIARREGIGDILAEGSTVAARKIGGGAEKYSIAVKNQSLPMHEPRLNNGLGLGYMVGPHGADHCCNMIDAVFTGFKTDVPLVVAEAIPLGRTEPVPLDDIGPRKVSLLQLVQFKRIIGDSLVFCQMVPFSFQQLANVTAAITGWETTTTEQLRIAERTWTMLRLFNVREGLTAEDDCLPERFFEPTIGGPLRNQPLDPQKMTEARLCYYRLLTWDDNGIPRPEKVAELNID